MLESHMFVQLFTSNKGHPRFFFGNVVTSWLSPGSRFLFSTSRHFAFQPCTALGEVSVVDPLAFLRKMPHR